MIVRNIAFLIGHGITFIDTLKMTDQSVFG